MFWHIDKLIKCNVCEREGIDLPTLTFNNLEGEPKICEQCLATLIFNKVFEYKKYIKIQTKGEKR